MVVEFVLFFGGIGLIMSFAVPKAPTVQKAFLWTLGVYLILFAAVGGMALFASPETLDAQMNGLASQVIQKNMEFYTESGMLTEAQLHSMELTMKETASLAIRVLPALIVLIASFVVFGNLVYLKEYMAVRGYWGGQRDLTRWSAPEALIWPVIGSGVIVALGRPEWLFRFGLNLLIVFLVPFLFHGLAIASFYLKKFRVPRWLRTLIYVLSFVQLWFVVFLFLGLFDMWLDFRRLKKQDQAPASQNDA